MAVASEGDFFGEEVANGKDGKEVDAVENDGHGLGKGFFFASKGSCLRSLELSIFWGRDSEGSGYARSIMSDFLLKHHMEG